MRRRGAAGEVAGAANGGSSGGGVRRRSGAAAGDGRGRARAAARRATGPWGPAPGLAGFGGGAAKWARDYHVARPGWLRAAARFVRHRADVSGGAREGETRVSTRISEGEVFI